MDCEMVGVSQGTKSALGRVTLVYSAFPSIVFFFLYHDANFPVWFSSEPFRLRVEVISQRLSLNSYSWVEYISHLLHESHWLFHLCYWQVNKWGNVLYDVFVRPVERVVDFRTHISGIRPRDLKKGWFYFHHFVPSFLNLSTFSTFALCEWIGTSAKKYGTLIELNLVSFIPQPKISALLRPK